MGDVATLTPRLDEMSLDFSNLHGETEGVGLSFLGWYIRGALRRDPRLWNSNLWINFFRRPLNYRHDNRDVDIFRGFGLRLRVLEGRPFGAKDSMIGQYQSYLRYAAMGLLLVNRQWPWVLAEDMHYDMYIGLDVLHSTAAFTFFSEGGRQCFMQSITSSQSDEEEGEFGDSEEEWGEQAVGWSA